MKDDDLAARFAYAAYDGAGALLALLGVVALPWLWWRGYGVGAGERLGALPAAAVRLAAPPLWLHAASVGEVRAAAPLVAWLRQHHPSLPLIVSTTTTTGREVARVELRPEVATLLPLDALRIVDAAFRRVRPRALAVVETEIWPGMLRAAARTGAPVAVLSGRVSPRSFARYRYVAPLLRAALARVAVFGMQSAADAERIIALGAPVARVTVSGNIKSGARRGGAALAPLPGCAGRPRLVAASTQPGEEELVLAACAPLWRRWPDLLLVLAPRRPERFDAVAEALAASGLRAQRRRAAPRLAADTQVLLLDTLGELPAYFPAAHGAFVGGTIAPLGGHNVLEPAQAGVAVAFGPHTENVAAAAAALCAAGGGGRVRDAAQLRVFWESLLRSSAAARERGERARAVAASGDAVARNVRLLAGLLDGEEAAARALLESAPGAVG